MSESKSKVDSLREWVVEHKLRSVGCLWLSGIVGSIAYNWSHPAFASPTSFPSRLSSTLTGSERCKCS
ncbi:hypothetical protein EV1_042864 [Malus domestica]